MILYSKKSTDQNDVGVDINVLKLIYLNPGPKVSECAHDLKDIFNLNYVTSDSSRHRGPHL